MVDEEEAKMGKDAMPHAVCNSGVLILVNWDSECRLADSAPLEVHQALCGAKAVGYYRVHVKFGNKYGSAGHKRYKMESDQMLFFFVQCQESSSNHVATLAQLCATPCVIREGRSTMLWKGRMDLSSSMHHLDPVESRRRDRSLC